MEFFKMDRRLKANYSWVATPLIVSAPMLGAATPKLAVEVTRAGGIGFLAGVTKSNTLDKLLIESKALLSASGLSDEGQVLPIGIGFQLWTSDVQVAAATLGKHVPAIAWLFAPSDEADLATWADAIRTATHNRTQIWVQVGDVRSAVRAVELARPDVLIAQGADAGGHGLVKGAGIVSLLPEVADAITRAVPKEDDRPVLLAAGGIVDGRGVAAALVLGAAGVVMGTRFLAASEAGIPGGWQRQIVETEDGGRTTNRSTLCDRLKETKGWPAIFDGRAVTNKGHEDEAAGMSDEDNVALYKRELAQGDAAWGPHGRMVTYAGTGVGLIHKVKPAAEIVQGTRQGAENSLRVRNFSHE